MTSRINTFLMQKAVFRAFYFSVSMFAGEMDTYLSLIFFLFNILAGFG